MRKFVVTTIDIVDVEAPADRQQGASMDEGNPPGT
jgi:hypothetical protein